jgi:rRNA maturation RNase YbeY
MNRQYVGHDYYTDIITFDYCDLEGRGVVSGDIFIDHETVDDNARQLGTAPREELLRVIIHGIMHLCGYKDKSDTEAAQMRKKEDFYLQRFPK